MSDKVRINLANAEELLELPGVGPAQVAAIVRHRSEHGPIKDAAELATILRGFQSSRPRRSRSRRWPASPSPPS